MIRRRQEFTVVSTLGGVLLLIAFAISCGSGATSTSSPSPKPAASVTAISGQDVSDRLVTVFVKDDASSAAVAEMAKQIAAMPEVEAYHFVTKEEALAEYKAMLGPDADALLKNQNPLPASFQVLVRDRADVAMVTERLHENSVVDNNPETEWSLPTASPSP